MLGQRIRGGLQPPTRLLLEPHLDQPASPSLKEFVRRAYIQVKPTPTMQTLEEQTHSKCYVLAAAPLEDQRPTPERQRYLDQALTQASGAAAFMHPEAGTSWKHAAANNPSTLPSLASFPLSSARAAGRAAGKRIECAIEALGQQLGN
jgi:hypothetical protein